MSNNTSKLTQPLAPAAAVAANHKLSTIYFRRSADGVTFDVTPVFMHPADAVQALSRSPAEYSIDGVTWAASGTALRNSAQPIGGRGRLQGASVAAD